MLYPQNGDRVVTVDSVTSLRPMYTILYIVVILPPTTLVVQVEHAGGADACIACVCVFEQYV